MSFAVTAAGWDETKHPRDPGGEDGGQFTEAGRNEYEGVHDAPGRDSGTPLSDLANEESGVYPDDVYSPDAARLYGHGGDQRAMDAETVAILQRYDLEGEFGWEPADLLASAAVSLRKFNRKIAAGAAAAAAVAPALERVYLSLLKAGVRDAADRFRAQVQEWDVTAAGFDPLKHPRHPGGDSRGGEWAPKYITAVIPAWENDGTGEIGANGEYLDPRALQFRKIRKDLATWPQADLMGQAPEDATTAVYMAFAAVDQAEFEGEGLVTVEKDGRTVGVVDYMEGENNVIGGFAGAIDGSGLRLFDGLLGEAARLGKGLSFSGTDESHGLYDRLGIPKRDDGGLPGEYRYLLARDEVERLNEDMFAYARFVTASAWVPPDPGDLVDPGEMADAAKVQTAKARKRMLQAMLVALDLDFEITNPFALELLDQLGRFAGRLLVPGLQQAVADAVAQGYAEGLSVPHTAELIESAGIKSRATMMARTDLTGLTNGASVAAARAVYPDGTVMKRWLSAHDDRVRPDHVEADGQTVPIEQPFIVGADELMFPGDPTGSDAETCNCFPADTRVWSAGEVEAATRYWYEGPLIKIRTSGGRDLSGTPNHPILTLVGWKALQELRQGDHVVCANSLKRVGFGDPHEDGVVAEIGEVYRASLSAGQRLRVGRERVNFHGDVPDGEVEIVRADRGLPVEVGEPLRDEILVGSNLHTEVGLPGDGAGGGYRESLFAPRFDFLPGGDGGFHAGGESLHPGKPGEVGGLFVPAGDAVLEQDALDNLTADGEGLGDGEFAFPFEVSFDDVVDIEVVPFAGHVYNLQTEDGWYSANGIVAHNCRCTTVYVPVAAVTAAGWDESKHPRDPGGEDGGQFVPKGGGRVKWSKRTGGNTIYTHGRYTIVSSSARTDFGTTGYKSTTPVQIFKDPIPESEVFQEKMYGNLVMVTSNVAAAKEWAEGQDDLTAAAWDESQHPRDPGGEGGGQFIPRVAVEEQWQAAHAEFQTQKRGWTEMQEQDRRDYPGMESDFADYYDFWSDVQFNSAGYDTIPEEWRLGYTSEAEVVAQVDQSILESSGLSEDTAIYTGRYGDPPVDRPWSGSLSKYIATSYADRTGMGKEDHLRRVLVPAGTKVGWSSAEQELVFPSGSSLEPAGGDLFIVRVPPQYVEPWVTAAGWVEADHPRDPGGEGGGQFIPKHAVESFADVPASMARSVTRKNKAKFAADRAQVEALQVPEPGEHGYAAGESVYTGGGQIYRTSDGKYHWIGPGDYPDNLESAFTVDEIMALAEAQVDEFEPTIARNWAARLRGKTLTRRNSLEVFKMFEESQVYNGSSERWVGFADRWGLDEQPILLNEAGMQQMGKDVLTSGFYSPEIDRVFISGDLEKAGLAIRERQRLRDLSGESAAYTIADMVGPMTPGGGGGQTTPSLLRHEYAHQAWSRFTDQQRAEFIARVPASKEQLAGLSQYASLSEDYYAEIGNRDPKFPWQGEVFAETVAAVTDPGFVREQWPGWVGELGDWVLSQERRS